MKKSSVLLVVAVVLLCVAGVLFVMHARRPGGAQPVPVRCENGHEFVPKRGAEAIVCPVCGSRTIVYLVYFRCTGCGHVFVAYERDPATGNYREPGGEWVAKTEVDFQPVCPECGGKSEFVEGPDAASGE